MRVPYMDFHSRYCYHMQRLKNYRSENEIIKKTSSFFLRSYPRISAALKGVERERERMEEKQLDYVLVPLGILVFGVYHVWFLFTLIRFPKRTVIGLNAETRRQWVSSMMTDPLKNGVLAIQTIRNDIMASTLLATAAITLISLISAFVSSTSSASSLSSQLVYGNKTSLISSIKYFCILLCFLLAFLFNVQAIRYYTHVGFLSTVSTSKNNTVSIEYVARNLNRGSYFWSLGLRAFYLSFPLFLWIFGPIPMFACCCLISILLYFLDTTTSSTRHLHSQSMKQDSGSQVME